MLLNTMMSIGNCALPRQRKMVAIMVETYCIRQEMPTMRRYTAASATSRGSRPISVTSGSASVTASVLKTMPRIALKVMLFMEMRALNRWLPAPRFWLMSTAAPEAIMVEEMMTRLRIWFATPTAAEALSEMRLSMKVLTVPISERRICSMRMGSASLSSAECGGAEERVMKGTSFFRCAL